VITLWTFHIYLLLHNLYIIALKERNFWQLQMVKEM
jgi:hypothetical protein